MKFIRIFVCGFFCLISFSKITAQLSSFDSSFVLISSPGFDFRNPQFDKSQSAINYFIKDCILAYEKWSDDNSSNISVRFIKFASIDSAYDLTNDSFLNIHPSVAYFSDLPEYNDGAVVFQSNRNDHWNIYFSKYSSNVWSTPVSVTPDTTDNLTPEISGYSINNSKNYLITYVRESDIYLKNYFNGVWGDEINVSSDDSLICFSPKISKGSFSSPTIYLSYLRKVNDSINSIAYHINQINTNGAVILGPRKFILQPNSQDNISYSQEFSSPVLVYDYDTLGKTNVYAASNNFSGNNELHNLSVNYSGNNFSGKFSTHGDITDGIYITASCWINEKSDSVNIFANIRNTFFGNPKKFYVGDTSVLTSVNLSTKLCKGSNNLYRFRMLWEKKVNGRIALIESHMDDFLASVIKTSNLTPDNFYLSQNYPNPFNPKTIIKYSIPTTQFTILKVYNALGKEVSTLVDKKQNAGTYEVDFNGEGLPSGIYFYILTVHSDKLETGDFIDTKRMILLK
ncbi:MAG: T9SS type A sorting domain-containing protein [Ignavibacteria bacterium]